MGSEREINFCPSSSASTHWGGGEEKEAGHRGCVSSIYIRGHPQTQDQKERLLQWRGGAQWLTHTFMCSEHIASSQPLLPIKKVTYWSEFQILSNYVAESQKKNSAYLHLRCLLSFYAPHSDNFTSKYRVCSIRI